MTPDEAVALVRRNGIVTLTAAPGVCSLVETIAGEPVRGSWWGHPKGKIIYAASEGLADSAEVLVVKLVGGKVTFVHASLWPALYRFVTDPDVRARAERAMGAAARELFALVEQRGDVRLDALGWDRGRLAKAKTELEKFLLVRSHSIHTERGAHATVFESWAHWASGTTRAAAARLAVSDAIAELERCAGRGALAMAGGKPRRP